MSIPERLARRCPAAVFAALCAMGLMAGSALAQRPSTVDETTAARIVRAAYSRMSELSAATEGGIRFELSDFATYDRSELDGVLWLDAVSMADGDVIDVRRQTVVFSDTFDERVAYVPSWRLHEETYLETDEAIAWGVETMTVREILDAAAENGEKNLARITAVTTFSVAAELAGRSRTYRAAAFWLPDRRDGVHEAFFIDFITQAIPEAAAEAFPMVGDWDQFMMDNAMAKAATEADARSELDVPLKSLPGTCVQRNQPFSLGWGLTNATGHIFGSHSTSGTFDGFCKCSTSCFASCRARVASSSCSDSGFTSTACHVFETSEIYDVDADLNGGTVSCKTAYTCGVKACLFCFCHFSVTITTTNIGFSFGSSGGLVHQFTVNGPNFGCPACTQL